jgi:hypothetical protein
LEALLHCDNYLFNSQAAYLCSFLKMKVFSGIALSFLAAASTAYGASWGFEDATLTVQQKGAGIGGGAKEK